MGRIGLAFRCFFAILGSGKLPEHLAVELGLMTRTAAKPAAKAPEAHVKASDGALQVLGILQRDARLVDFFMEDISAYSDDQVGAAVRSMHEQSQKTITQYFKLSPVIDGVEGAYTKVGDTDTVKLVGNVPPDGRVPGGILRHRGWKVDSVALPNIPSRTNLAIVAPAEVEVE